jgi:hypothetical protein
VVAAFVLLLGALRLCAVAERVKHSKHAKTTAIFLSFLFVFIIIFFCS